MRITRLDLLIDGTARGMIQINQLRTDICSAEQLRGCPAIGFIRQVDLTAFDLKPGSHSLQIRATNSRGAFKIYPAEPIRFNFEGAEGRRPVGASRCRPKALHSTPLLRSAAMPMPKTCGSRPSPS